MSQFFSSSWGRFLISANLVLLLVVFLSMAKLNFEQARNAEMMPASISVTGEGKVTAIPDVAQFSFSVDVKADTAVTAQTQSAEQLNAVTAYLAEAGVATEDIKTVYYDLYPEYRWEEPICALGMYCPGEQVEDGYTAAQTVQVKVRDTARAGELIAGVGERGATNISGLSLIVDNDEELREEARLAAIDDAKAQIDALAEQLGVRVERFQGYWEEASYGDDMMYARDFAEQSSMATDAAVPNIPTGQTEITARVNVTYEVK